MSEEQDASQKETEELVPEPPNEVTGEETDAPKDDSPIQHTSPVEEAATTNAEPTEQETTELVEVKEEEESKEKNEDTEGEEKQNEEDEEKEMKEEEKEKKEEDEEGSNKVENIPTIPSIVIQLEEEMSSLVAADEEKIEDDRLRDNLTEAAEKEEEEEEEEEEEADEEEEFDRDEAIEHYKELFGKMEKLQQTHHQLQHKIAEYLARKVESKRDVERDVTDQEQRYQRCLKGLDELQKELAEHQRGFEKEEEQMKLFCQQKQVQVSQARNEFADLIREQTLAATNSRTGRKLNMHDVTNHLGMLEKKDEEVTKVRLENIKLQNRINKLDAFIKQKEQLAEGLHMIDFEQLRINNADLNDKIEERNEEILKLKKKITSTIQVLAHLKEKLQFLQAENAAKKTVLKEVEKHVAKKRDLLTRLKQAKDSIRSENTSLKQQGGLVSYHKLLKDFENKQDQSEEMKLELQILQNRHSNLILQCNTLRQRIDQTRLVHT